MTERVPIASITIERRRREEITDQVCLTALQERYALGGLSDYERSRTLVAMIDVEDRRIAREERDMLARLREESWVYVIGRLRVDGPELVKIGHSYNPGTRLSQLQTGSAHELYLAGVARGTRDNERFLHWRFRASCVGGEWFEVTQELAKFMRSRLIPGGMFLRHQRAA